jgi:DedD protein
MSLSTFFQRFRPGASSGRTAASDAVPLSASDIEATRVRARRRLIGMVVLVGAGVVGFPWLFETQPRAMSPDVQIVQAPTQAGGDSAAVSTPTAGSSRSVAGRVAVAGIVAAPSTEQSRSPERAQASDGAGAASSSRSQQGQAAPADEVVESATKAVAAQASIKAQEPASQAAHHGATPASHASVAHASQAKPSEAEKHDRAEKSDKPLAKPAAKEPAHATDKNLAKDSAKPVGKDAANAAQAAKASAKPASKPAQEKSDKPANRYVVQFGAFADANTAHEARMKVERLGVKTYAQQVDTPAGKRIRVRVGPYADKAEADKAMATIRKAGLAGAVLTL